MGVQGHLELNAPAPRSRRVMEYGLTCDWCLDFYHGLFRSEKRCALVDDLEGGGLIDSALQDEVLLQDLWPGLVGARVEYLTYCQLIRRGERNT